MTDDLMEPREVATRLGVSTRTLKTYRDRGVGPSYVALPSGQARYPATAVESYLADNFVQLEGAPA